MYLYFRILFVEFVGFFKENNSNTDAQIFSEAENGNPCGKLGEGRNLVFIHPFKIHVYF